MMNDILPILFPNEDASFKKGRAKFLDKQVK